MRNNVAQPGHMVGVAGALPVNGRAGRAGCSGQALASLHELERCAAEPVSAGRVICNWNATRRALLPELTVGCKLMFTPTSFEPKQAVLDVPSVIPSKPCVPTFPLE